MQICKLRICVRHILRASRVCPYLYVQIYLYKQYLDLYIYSANYTYLKYGVNVLVRRKDVVSLTI